MANSNKPEPISQDTAMADLAALKEAMAYAKTAFDIRQFMGAANGEDEDGGLLGCPCFRIRLEGFEADGHCWRAGCTPAVGQDDGGLCCVHVRGDQEAGERLKELLDAMDWYGTWTLHFGDDCR